MNAFDNSKLSIAGLFFFLLVFISCKGQEKSRTPQEGRSNADSISGDFQVNIYELSLQNSDPLFYLDGQLCAWVRNIFQDSKGNLWFGTNHYGVMRYDGDTLEYFSVNEGLGEGRINTIVEDNLGNVWLGNFDGLSKYNPSERDEGHQLFTNNVISKKKTNNDVWAIETGREGIHWIGTNEGVIQFDGMKYSSFFLPKVSMEDTTSILSYDCVTSIIEDQQGILWFGTDGFGIWQYDPKTEEFFHISTKDGLQGNNISGFLEDSKGHIWIATMYGGISLYNGNSFINFNEADNIRGVEISGLFEDRAGNIWFSSEGFGVYRFDGTTFTNIHRDHGLETDGILSIFEDKEGRFWFGGWGGLFRYYPAKEARGERSVFRVSQYGPWN